MLRVVEIDFKIHFIEALTRTASVDDQRLITKWSRRRTVYFGGHGNANPNPTQCDRRREQSYKRRYCVASYDPPHCVLQPYHSRFTNVGSSIITQTILPHHYSTCVYGAHKEGYVFGRYSCTTCIIRISTTK